MTVSNLAHYDIGIQVNHHNKNSKASSPTNRNNRKRALWSLWQGLHSSSARKLHKIGYYPLAPQKEFWDHSSEDGVKWGRQTGSSKGKQTKSNPKEDWKPLQLRYMHNKIACFKISPTFSNCQERWRLCWPRTFASSIPSERSLFPSLSMCLWSNSCSRTQDLGHLSGCTLTHAYNDSTAEVLLDYVLACLAFIKGVFVQWPSGKHFWF